MTVIELQPRIVNECTDKCLILPLGYFTEGFPSCLRMRQIEDLVSQSKLRHCDHNTNSAQEIGVVREGGSNSKGRERSSRKLESREMTNNGMLQVCQPA